MTEGDRDNSGELSSFLHLTGWRPLVLALIAGIAGAFGLLGALNAPAEYQARFTMNAQRIADDDFTPAQLDIFVEEIAKTAEFGQVIRAVEARTGLVHEVDYEISVGQSSTLSNVDVNVVAGDPDDARTVAIETLIEAMTITVDKTLGGDEASAAQIEGSIREIESRISELTIEAGGINPSTAYDRAVQAVFDREDFLRNPPQETVTLNDGSTVTRDVEEPDPPLEELKAEVARLEPLDREYRNEIAALDGLNLRLADRNNDIRDARAALTLIETERDDPVIISEVETEETSRIAGLLTGLLIFAVPAALLTILGFVIFDALRKKPELAPAVDFDPAGALEAESQRALPEGQRGATLTVVDEDELDVPPPLDSDILAEAEEAEVEHDTDVTDDDDDDNEPTTKKRSKDGRWGRDASSKAG